MNAEAQGSCAIDRRAPRKECPTFLSVLAAAALLAFAGPGANAQTGYSFDPNGNLETAAALSATGPSIVTQPAGGTAPVGGSFAFTVIVGGQGPFSYQWMQGVNSISTGTSDTLTLQNLTQTAGGEYTVKVTNGIGSITSNPAGLTVAPTSNALEHVAFGAGRFVAVGTVGTLLTSTDATTWAPVNLGSKAEILNVIYANGQFVATGWIGEVFTSPNGTTWTQQYAGTFNNLPGLAYGDDRYVAVGGAGTVTTSSNATNWTLGAPLMSGTTFAELNGLTYGNGLFIAVGDGGTIQTSPDGVNWTARTSGVATDLNAVTFGAGNFPGGGRWRRDPDFNRRHQLDFPSLEYHRRFDRRGIH